ncbi:hypothetical protein D3C80_284000 [compost metagenome]
MSNIDKIIFTQNHAKASGSQFVLIYNENACGILAAPKTTGELGDKQRFHFRVGNCSGALEQFVGNHLEPGKALDAGKQLKIFDWLRHEVICACFKSLDFVFCAIQRCQDHNRNIGSARVIF